MVLADIIVPLPLRGDFTYSIPDCYSKDIAVGCRVIVQFGKRKHYTGIVRRIYESKDSKDGIKEILSLLDLSPIILPEQFLFWEWISSYYMCTLGEVYKAALPSALKLESETLVFLNETFEASEKFTPNEEKIFYLLSSEKSLKISEIEKKTAINNVIHYVKSLVDKGAAFLNENVSHRYRPKTEMAVCLSQNYSDEELTTIIQDLKRAKKQQELFLEFLRLKDNAGNELEFFILKKDLIKDLKTTYSIIDSLLSKGILKSFDYEISRLDNSLVDLQLPKKLNTYQEQAYNEISECFKEKDVVLLHGVTSSGKTEIYIQLINEAIAKGKQVLYLLPEIALTTQITERLRSVFGNKLFVYHSKFNDNERAETWQTLLNKAEGCVILGARSSVFLPFKNLELIIVDEEHESSYKQQDPAPRYNAKNAAVVLAGIHTAKILLGTATPSIESYYNALSGRYGLVELDKRFENIELPQITVVNTKELRRRKQMKNILSPYLATEIDQVISKQEQVILFQNRRGFAPMLECKTCFWTPKCLHCDVSLTYHKAQRAMMCHYCGAVYSIPTDCPECKTPSLETQGYGTERIEQLVSEELPAATILRMDLDTTRSKRAYEHIISDFEKNKANVLIGTQMVSKGLDFDNVSLVGILNADNMLNYPDFRAHERAFQLIMQVSGRAGRKNKRGNVILQTAHPDHPIISFIKKNDYKSFYELQIDERKLFKYPPFFRIIEIVLRDKDEALVNAIAYEFSQALKQSFQDRVLGPTKPAVARVQSLYIRKIILKIENQASPQKVREAIESCSKYLLNKPKYRYVLLHYDVDPM